MLALLDRLLDFLSPKIEVEALHTGKTTLNSVVSSYLLYSPPHQCDYKTAGCEAQTNYGRSRLRCMLIGIEVLTIGLCLVCMYTL